MTTPGKICGFGLATGPICYEVRAGEDQFCGTHEMVSTCTGCGQRASRECDTFLGKIRCAASLCERCEHKDGGIHGLRLSAAQQARETLIGIVELSLRDAAGQGLLSLPPGGRTREAAGLVVDHATAHTFLQIASAIANPRG